MNILGIAVIWFLPYMAGYIIRTVVNRRETGQIETYLIGFFSVFLLQGITFTTGDLLMGWSFITMCDVFRFVTIAIAVLFVAALAVNTILSYLRGREKAYRHKLKKDEWILLGLMILVAVLIAVRIVLLMDYTRDDYMLPTVRTTLSTHTINRYNPITKAPYNLGLIASRKIITLPVYYAYLCFTFGIDSITLLYIILTAQTIMCCYFACILFITPILRFRSRIYIFGIFLGGLILSGDYFADTIGSKIMWKGYAGDSIVAAVMIPYVLCVIMSDYRQINVQATTEKHSADAITVRIKTILKLGMVCAGSVFITTMVTGLLLLIITVTVASCCYFVIKKKNLQINEDPLIVGE